MQQGLLLDIVRIMAASKYDVSICFRSLFRNMPHIELARMIMYFGPSLLMCAHGLSINEPHHEAGDLMHTVLIRVSETNPVSIRFQYVSPIDTVEELSLHPWLRCRFATGK